MGAPPRQQTLVQTVVMPEIAGASSSNARVCRRAATQSTTGLAQHQPLQTPQTIFPLPGHVIVSFYGSGGSWEDHPGSGAPQAMENPGARASPFSQG